MTFPIYGKIKNVPNHQPETNIEELWRIMMYQPGKDEAELTPWSKPRVFAMGFGMVVFYS